MKSVVKSLVPGTLLAGLLILGAAATAFAHGGEDHSQDGKAPAAMAAGTTIRTFSAVSERLELVVKVPALPAGQRLDVEAFLTDWATNEPLRGARLTFSVPDLGLDEQATASTALVGRHDLHLQADRSGSFAMIVSVQAPSLQDLLVLDAVEFGPAESAPVAAATAQQWLLPAVIGFGVALLVVLLAGLLRPRRSRSATALLLALALGLLHAAASRAHGGEDHGDGPKLAAPASVATVSKDAQLLFGVRTTVARLQALPSRRRLTGVVVPRPHGVADVFAPLAGRTLPVEGQLVQIGDHVVEGQPLVVLEGILSPQERIDGEGSLAEARAREVAATEELRLAEAELRRADELPQLVSQAEHETMAARGANATAGLQAARRSVSVLRSSLQGGSGSATQTILRAPIAGVITEVHVTLGELAEPGHRLFRILDASRLYVRADVPERDAIALVLPPSAPARIVPRAGATSTEIRAAFITVSRSVDATTRTVPYLFEATEGSAALLEGMLVDVLVEAGGTGDGVVLPVEAVTSLSGRTVVFVKTAPEAFEPRDVVLGPSDPTSVELVSGVRNGERVVVAGAFQVRAALLSGSGL